jgi:G:T/U-mismatch repair DNA glycosylase
MKNRNLENNFWKLLNLLNINLHKNKWTILNNREKDWLAFDDAFCTVIKLAKWQASIDWVIYCCKRGNSKANSLPRKNKLWMMCFKEWRGGMLII